MNRAVIGLGSNINPQANIVKAEEALKQQFKVLKRSSFVETKPVGFVAKNNFLNGAVLIETELGAEDLKEALHQMERNLGRSEAEKKFTSRTIDLDIVVFNDEIIDQDIYKRDFLKKAVLELLPSLKV